MEGYVQGAMQFAIDVGGKVIGALILWVVGKWAIGIINRLLNASMLRQKVDPTLVTYAGSAVNVLLNILLVIAVLGVFGVETTTFAGLLAAAGVAIGMAWSGLLANFAAGIFMVVLRPFAVGDFIAGAGVMGTVREIGLFVTAIDTMDNVRTYVGNGKLFADNIQNFTTNPFRRVDLVAQLAHSVDVADAIARLRARLVTIPNVVATPGPDVHVLTFTLAGPVLCVRPYCHNDHYWDVYFATNKAIADVCGEAGYAVPEQHLHLAGGMKG